MEKNISNFRRNYQADFRRLGDLLIDWRNFVQHVEVSPGNEALRSQLLSDLTKGIETAEAGVQDTPESDLLKTPEVSNPLVSLVKRANRYYQIVLKDTTSQQSLESFPQMASARAQRAQSITGAEARFNAARAATIPPPLAANQQEQAEIANVLQNPDPSQADLDRLVLAEIDKRPLTFDLASAGDAGILTDTYLGAGVNDARRLQSYSDNVLQDWVSHRPEGTPQELNAQNLLRSAVRPGEEFNRERINAMFVLREDLVRIYLRQLQGYYDSIRPVPENASDLAREFKRTVTQADVVNRDFALDITLLEDLRTEVGKLRDRTRPGFLRRAWSYTTGFLSPSRLKSRRAVALTILATSAATAGVLLYNPQLFANLGIIGPESASTISRFASRLFSSDFFGALGSAAQWSMRQAGAVVVPAKDYLWNWITGAGSAVGPTATADQIAEAARNASALVPIGVAPSGAASAAASSFAAIPAGVGSAVSSVYSAVANWLTGAPPEIVVPAAGAAGVVGAVGAYAAGQKLLDRVWSKQAVDAAELINTAAVKDLAKKSSRITGALGGDKADVTRADFVEMKQKADQLDELATQVAADAAVVSTQAADNTPIEDPLANSNIAVMVADIDAMAAVSDDLKKTSERITNRTLRAEKADLKEEIREEKALEKEIAKEEKALEKMSRKSRKTGSTGRSSKKGGKSRKGKGKGRGKSSRSRSPSSRGRKSPSKSPSRSPKTKRKNSSGSATKKRSPPANARPRRANANYGGSRSRKSPSRRR